MTHKTHICTKCTIEKTFLDFHKSKTGRFGIRSDCKQCCNAVSTKNRLNNKEYFKRKNLQSIITKCFFCDNEYSIHLYELNRNKKRNNGNYRCKYCAINQTINLRIKYVKNENYFNEIDSEIKAYLLGVVAGDGHLSKSGSYLEIVANKQDKETLDLFIKEISPNTKILKHSTSENCFKVNIYSKKINQDICRHLKISPGKKSDKISLPNIDDKLFFPFIRGLMDSDGWISDIIKQNKRRCFYSSSSRKILKQVQNIAFLNGIKSSILGIKLYFNGVNAERFLNLIYTNSSVHLSRKYNRYKNWSHE